MDIKYDSVIEALGKTPAEREERFLWDEKEFLVSTEYVDNMVGDRLRHPVKYFWAKIRLSFDEQVDILESDGTMDKAEVTKLMASSRADRFRVVEPNLTRKE